MGIAISMNKKMDILRLPDEIKVKIFQYLNGTDKIEILQVCEEFRRIGVDRKILEFMDFSYNYKFNLKSHLKYIGRKITSNLVTNINLNGVYWIPSAELRNCIVRFENLNELRVVDTQLSYRDLVVALNTTKEVRKLAFSLRPDNCGDVYMVQIETPITHLYVTYYSHQIKCLFRLLGHFSELEELWMIEPCYPHKIIEYEFIVQQKIPKIKERIVILQKRVTSRRLDNFKEYYVDGFNYENWDVVVATEEKYNYFTVLENRANKINNIDDGFNVRSLEKYATINDVHNIRSSNNIEDIKLAGLNISKNYFEDPSGISKQLRTILTQLPATRSLKKWKGLSKCFWEEKQVEQSHSSLFKKRRIGLSFPKLDENNLFASFTRHTPEMEDFEITDDTDESIRKQLWQTDSLKFARNWMNLKCLTITSVNLKYGKFIIDVLKSCTQLNRLKVLDNSFQDDFSADLCNGLQYAVNLKDFRYERKGSIPIDKLFNSLKSCKRLERIHVQCLSAHVISKTPIEKVVTVCENLVYFFLFISELPETVCRTIKQGIQELSLKPQQIIFIKGQPYVWDNVLYTDLPMFHIEDMVCQSNYYHLNFVRNSF